MEKSSSLLMDILYQKCWYLLPNYPFKYSLDEEIASAYFNDEENAEELKKQQEIEEYCKYCLDNIHLLEELNKE